MGVKQYVELNLMSPINAILDMFGNIELLYWTFFLNDSCG